MNSDIRIRRAHESDRPAMLEITRDVWGGTDYLPFRWDPWISDPNGFLMVATRNHRVVGLQHLYIQPDGACWLEGIRVAADQQGQGVAQVMFNSGVTWARENECYALRLTTSSGNPASRRIAEKGGLRVVEKFDPSVAPPSDEAEESAGVRLAAPPDFDIIWEHLLATGSRFYTEAWTAYRLTQERLRLLLARSSVLIVDSAGSEHSIAGFRSTTRIDGAAIVTCFGSFKALRVGLLTGSLDSRRKMLSYSRRAAAEARLDEVRGTILADEVSRQATGDAGFEPSFEFSVELWELNF